MKKLHKNTKRFLVALLIFFVGGIALLTVLSRTVKLPSSHRFQAQATSMPPDDTDFISWLQEQPGVPDHSVSVYREENILFVRFVSVHTASGNPPLPDIDRKAKELGYVLESNGFQQIPPDDE